MQSQWRRFQFFDKGWDGGGKVSRSLGEALKGNQDAAEPLVTPDAAAFLPSRRGASVKTKPGVLFFGDDAGLVYLANENCQLVAAPFRAFPALIRGVCVATRPDGEPLLVVLGALEEGLWAVKVYRIDALTGSLPRAETGIEPEPEPDRLVPLPPPPTRLRVGNLSSDHFILTAFAVSASCSQVRRTTFVVGRGRHFLSMSDSALGCPC